MQKILISVLVCIIYFSTINCTANEKQLTKLESELLNCIMASLNYSVKENIKNGDQLGMFLQLEILNGTISSLAYAMVLNPDGEILAHNIPEKASEKLDDAATKKVLEYRDISEVLIQKLKLNNNRDVLDISMPLISSDDSKEYIGAVRIAIYVN